MIRKVFAVEISEIIADMPQNPIREVRQAVYARAICQASEYQRIYRDECRLAINREIRRRADEAKKVAPLFGAVK